MTGSTVGVWGDVGTHLVRLLLAFVFSLPIAWNREREARSTGLRTFPMVALASCGFVMLGIQVLGAQSASQARMLEGLITGIGFIGGGAILKGAATRGTATAASMLNTGIVGGAVGYGLYDIGLVLALANLVVLVTLGGAKNE